MSDVNTGTTVPELLKPRLAVDTKPTGLLKLLFWRHAWDLAVGEEVPSPEPVPDVGTSTRPKGLSEIELREMWTDLWDRSTWWYSRHGENHADPMHPMPRWSDISAVPDGVDTSAFHDWSWQFRERSETTTPETVIAKEIAAARVRGLRSITVLPMPAEFVQYPTPEGIIVSAEFRNNPTRYASVLASIPPQSSR